MKFPRCVLVEFEVPPGPVKPFQSLSLQIWPVSHPGLLLGQLAFLLRGGSSRGKNLRVALQTKLQKALPLLASALVAKDPPPTDQINALRRMSSLAPPRDLLPEHIQRPGVQRHVLQRAAPEPYNPQLRRSFLRFHGGREKKDIEERGSLPNAIPRLCLYIIMDHTEVIKFERRREPRHLMTSFSMGSRLYQK